MRVHDVRISTASYGYGGERTHMVTLTPERAALAGFGITGARVRAPLARYGLTPAAFAAAIGREVSSGTANTRVTLGGEEIEVRLKSEGARERTMEELREAFIP